MNSNILFQYSPWFILLCILVGVGYAFLMYQKKYTFTKNQQIGLAIVRGVVVTTLCFLLLNPLFKREESNVISPTIVLAIDNSTSAKVIKSDEFISKLRDLASELANENLSIAFRTLTEDNIEAENLDKITFDAKSTNLSQLLASLATDYEGQNLTDVVVISDGIVNAGVSPAFLTYPFRVHTVGVGDTTQKRDVRIIGLYANQVAYVGNTFPIEAEINAYSFAGKQVTALLKKGDQIVDKQLVNFSSEDDIKRVSFKVKEDKEGIQRYRVEVLPIAGEASTKNNRQDTYVEIIDGKEKILLLAMAPHPDIKAFRAIIDKNELYDLTIKVNSSDNFKDLDNIDFDILILHQFPDMEGRSRQFLPKLLARNKPTFFILGAQSDIMTFNGMQEAIGINAQAGRVDQVTAVQNTAFKRYNLSPEQTQILSKFPTMTAPFGDYRPSSRSDVILWQQVGNVVTTRPLLVVNTNVNRKTAVLTGEGVWRWRMEEFDLTNAQVVVDDIVSKAIQLISVKEDKRKLRVYTTLPTYGVDDVISFENEVYNNIYERIFDQPVTLTLTNEKGVAKTFNYTTTADKTSYEVAQLTAGVYRYKATAKVLGKNETAEGQFVVSDVSLEDLNTTADFGLLRAVSQQNNGKFVNYSEIDKLKSIIQAFDRAGKALSTESIDEVISQRWVLILLLLLVTIEWAVRKYLGTY